MSGWNIGSDFVDHKKNCRCDECEIERMKDRIAEQEAQLKDEPYLREYVLDGDTALFGNAAIKFLQDRIGKLEAALHMFVDAYDRALSHNLGESWASSYLNNNSWKAAKEALED